MDTVDQYGDGREGREGCEYPDSLYEEAGAKVAKDRKKAMGSADIVMRVAVKPTSSITKKQHTEDVRGDHTTIQVFGRHDPCIVPRIIPVIEDMAALVLYDCWAVQSRLNPDWPFAL